MPGLRRGTREGAGRDSASAPPGWPGQVAPAFVERQLGQRLRAVVRAYETLAYRPATARDEEAVL
eukprot:5273242-Lingulodinium_polyedra.AAC.1